MSSLAHVSMLNRRSAVRFVGAGLAAALLERDVPPARASHTNLEANKAIARRLFEDGINQHNRAAIAEIYAADFVDHGTWARQMPGPAGMPVTIDELSDAHPDVIVAIESEVAEGDLIAVRATWRGTHPPAGTHVLGRTMHLFRISNGVITEEWSAGWDWIAPSPSPPAARPDNPLLWQSLTAGPPRP